jgi:hypothetical protein
MAASLTCRHCNGTTFCGGSLGAGGKLKKSPACISCVVKSGLDPATIHDRVVCSVCGGVGVVEPRKEPLRSAPTPVWMLLMVPLFVSTVIALVLTLISYNSELARNRELQEKLAETWTVRHGNLMVEEIRAKVAAGMSKEEARELLGNPDAKKELGSGVGMTELWYYNCVDGRLVITIQDGTVQGVRQL